MDLIIATQNKGKVREIRQLLKGLKLKIYSLLNFPKTPSIKERGKTFKDNAIAKAKFVAKKFGKIALADDSGLEVYALSRGPGIRSSRYAYPPTSLNLCTKLLKALKGERDRRARFVCFVAISTPSQKIYLTKGYCKGRISEEMRGRNGFGYDPVFIPNGYKKTFAELSPLAKNRISHRGKALKAASLLLRKIYSKI